jgi:hypothetical protein
MLKNTFTTVVNEAANKGKKVLYLVLKRKTNERRIIEDLEKELDIKMQMFLENIQEKIINAKFDNKERALKYILLKGLINILEKMIVENMGKLSDEDKKLIEDIMKEDNNPQNDDDNGKDAKNKKTSKIPKDQQFAGKDNYGQLKGPDNFGNNHP